MMSRSNDLQSRLASLTRLVALPLIAVLAAGCSAPKEEPSVNAGDPKAQNTWIAAAVENNDISACQGLIELLDSSDPAERLVAIGALRSITGEHFGYRIADPPAVRGQAVDRWAAWWMEYESSGNASTPTAGADTES